MKNYKNFWTALVEQSFASVIVEESFIPEFIFWVSRMTTSEYRTMRLSSTVVLLGLVSGFCALINKYQNEFISTLHPNEHPQARNTCTHHWWIQCQGYGFKPQKGRSF